MALVLGANVFVIVRIWQILPDGFFLKLLVVLAYIICMAGMFSYFGGTLEKIPMKTATAAYGIFNTWLIFFLYVFLAFLVIWILKVCHLFPQSLYRHSFWGSLLVFGSVAAVLVIGNIHYRNKFREHMEISSEKTIDRPLKILFASDLHLGYHNRKDELSRWVDIINSEKPDLVLLGGDLIDMSLRPVLDGDYASVLRKIEAPVYAVLGNHEYYSGCKESEEFFSSAGIHLLKDDVVSVMGINVIGRDDRTNRSRKTLNELMDRTDPEKFSILLDHQPSDLSEAMDCGVDFQFSGHTHRGQVWPISWITDLIFEDSWGPYTKGNTRYYVSSGLGIWGAKIRVGTRSEYLVLDLYSSIL